MPNCTNGIFWAGYSLSFHFSSQEFAKKLKTVLGPKGNTVFDKRRDKSFLRTVEDLLGSMREFQKDKEPGNLKEYSSWLSSFKADAFGNDLEIPGRRIRKWLPSDKMH